MDKFVSFSKEFSLAENEFSHESKLILSVSVICRPFVGPLYCTMKNARYVTSIIYLIGVFYAIPLMFEYEPYEDRGLSDLLFVNHKFKFFRRKPTFLGRNPTFRWIYVLINAVGVYLVPLSIIAVLNRKLLISIRLLEKRSAELNAPLPTKQGLIERCQLLSIVSVKNKDESAAKR